MVTLVIDIRTAINRRAIELRRINSGLKPAFSPIYRALLDSLAIYREAGARIIRATTESVRTRKFYDAGGIRTRIEFISV